MHGLARALLAINEASSMRRILTLLLLLAASFGTGVSLPSGRKNQESPILAFSKLSEKDEVDFASSGHQYEPHTKHSSYNGPRQWQKGSHRRLATGDALNAINPPECSDALCLVQALLNRRPEIYITSNVDLEGVGILPTIENRVSITGICDKSKCRLDAKGSSGMFVVGLSGYLTLKDLELTGGFCNQGPAVLVTGLGADNSNGGGKLEALNVKFINNIATDVGGAVSIESGGSAFVSNSVFYNNKANKGGAVYVGGSTQLPPRLPLPVISTPGALPPNPSASSRPAGCGFRSCTTFANTEFSRNQAAVSGGAVFADDSSPECADVGGAQVDCTTCTFLNNTAGHEGGALLLAFVSSGATANTKQSAFLSNIAGGDGGDVNIQAGQAGAPGAQLHAYSTAFAASSARHGLSVAVGRAASATFTKCDFSSYIVANSTLCEGTCKTTCPVDKGLQQLQGSCPDALPPAPLCPWISQDCPPPVESALPLTPSSSPPQIVLPPSASPPPPGSQIIPPPPPSPSNPPPPPPVILPPQSSPSIHLPPPSPTPNPPGPPLPPQLPSPSISPPPVSQAPPSIPPPASPPPTPTPPSSSLNPPPALPQTAPPPPIPTFIPPPPPIQPFPTPSLVSPPPPRQRRPRRPRQPPPPPFLGSPPPPTSAFPPPPPKKKWPSPPSGSQGTVENAPPAPPPPSPSSTDFQSPPPPPKRRWAFPPPPNGQGSVENAPPAPPPPPATLAFPPPAPWAFPPPQGQGTIESAPPAPPPPPSSQGSVKGDPHFVGKHGERFDFHGKNGRDYCVVSDKNIHINMHVYHGKLRKSTFISKLGILYKGHRILIEAQINGKQNHTWKLAFDDVGLTHVNSSLTRGGLTITRGPQFAHIFAPGEVDVLADIIHATFGKRGSLKNYINLQVTQLRVSPDVHGLLGQTYKETTRTYEKLHAAKSKKHSRAAEVLVDGSESDYLTTDILSPDCKFATFEAQATWPKRVKRTLLGTVQKLLFVASKDRLVRGCVGFGDQALCHA